MPIEHITNLQALGFVAGILVFAWVLFRVVPSGGHQPTRETFTPEEIQSYDRELPKYFLVAALALTIGSLHTVIKNLPGFWQWLWRAGYGGHLFRDLSNSHIIIVGGGTVLLTALTWYVLPRFTNRPLFSTTLAGISFWATVAGVFGFYLAWLSLGLVEGSMVANGWTYEAAKAYLGNWHRLPTAITSSIMGVGYWTYVLNVFLTWIAARKVAEKPLGYLTKFSVVSAGALFVGTVQGVIQVLPDNADWIHAAGKFGEYVDPISHAHVNLVTGMMVSMAAFLIYFGPRMGGRRPGKSASNILFWVLVPGSLAFYLAFLLAGLVLGGAVNGTGAAWSQSLVPFFSRNLRLIFAFAGSLMLAGFWAYFLLLWRSFGLRSLVRDIRSAATRAFWLLSSFALVIGTLQGLLQLLPATARLFTTPEEVPNIHAQLNMIGGILLALLGIVYWLLPQLIGEPVALRYRRLSLLGVAGGIGGYYLVTLTSGLLRYGFMRSGMDSVAAAAQLGWIAPALLVLTALPLLVGFSAFARGLWLATAAYRAGWIEQLRRLPQRLNGRRPEALEHYPAAAFVAAEAASALAGFPGLGWLLTGQGVVGVPLALTGPAVAWGVIPVLMSPFGDGALVGMGITPLVVYLVVTTLLSSSLLWLTIRRGPQYKEAAG